MIREIYLDMYTNCFILTMHNNKIVNRDFFDLLFTLKKCGFKEDIMLLDNTKLLEAVNKNLKRLGLSLEN